VEILFDVKGSLKALQLQWVDESVSVTESLVDLVFGL